MRSGKFFAIAVMLSLFATPARASDKDISFFTPQLDGKALIFVLAGAKFGITDLPFPVAAGSPGGQLQIGFSHSGYTVQGEPRRAELLIVVDIVSAELSQNEKQSLLVQGVEVLSTAAPQATNLVLNLNLPSDTGEEARLRAALGLPKSFSAGTLQMLSFQWADVSGSKLYGWLTAADGLRISLGAVGSSMLRSQSSWSIDAAKLATWWTSRVGNSTDRLVTGDGFGVLAFELLSAGVLSAEQSGSGLNRTGSQIQGLKALAERLMAASQPLTDGRRALTQQAVAGVNINVAEADDIRNQMLLATAMAPGAVLKDHPEYVVDNSAGIPGLDALLRDH